MAQAPDGLDMLIADHRKVDELFTQCRSSGDDAKRQQLQQRIIEELSVHAAVEEMVRAFLTEACRFTSPSSCIPLRVACSRATRSLTTPSRSINR